MICEVWHIGRIGCHDAWALQNRLAEARSDPDGMDRLLLVEHPHTYTLGTAGHEHYLLMPPHERARLGIEVVRVDRGGDITYHGPGQIVAYPILQLPQFERGSVRTDVIGYVRKLEEVVIRVIDDYGISGKRIDGLTGVWVDTPRGEEKIAAIGVRVNVRGVTKHGFALNVNTDLNYFRGIVPCGIADKGVTSIAALLGYQVEMIAAQTRVMRHFGEIFQLEMKVVEPRV